MILQFHNVSADAHPPYESGLAGASFSLDAGDLLLLHVEADLVRTPLPDLAQGLLAQDDGNVVFMGESWRNLSPDRSAELRGSIGRVFETGGWISNLDVDENVTLAQRYHSGRREQEILDEAQELARAFGLQELPKGRPHLAVRNELRRAQWVRAFIGRPALVILENPTEDLQARWGDMLVQQTRRARDQGAAVVWITSNPVEGSNDALKPTLKFALRDMKMQPA